MCGICGLIDPAGVRDGALDAMLGQLVHRGPDDAGVHLKGSVGLGHRRLSIIDLDQGHQPISNEDESVWVVLNGEIYNYRGLREELVERGHRFRTHSDTEVLVHLWEEEGAACVKRLRGMFAFALWDDRRQQLFAARDHLGQKPLFYTETRNGLAFASEIKALLAADPALAELDPEALEEYLALRIVTPPRTMFRRVRKLPPAHTLTWDERKGLRIARYWDLDYEPKLRGSDEELIDGLEEQLVESLRLHMVSDVPVGAFLSGGLDSTLVVALLGKHVLDEPIDTFAGKLDYGEFDESPAARSVAERYGTRHHEQSITPSLVRLLPRLLWHMDEPSDALSVCCYLIAGLARSHVKVALGGDGGDELFGGYDRYYGNRYADLYASMPATLRRHLLGPVIDRLGHGGWYKSRSNQLRWLHQMSFLKGGRRYAASLGYSYFGESARSALLGPAVSEATAAFDPYATISAAYDRAPAEDPIDRMLYADSQLRLTDHSVMILDRMSMAHGLEARSPFLDHELAGYCARLPMRVKVRGRQLRWIQTQLAKRYLPREVLERPKQGFASALPYMLREEYRLLFRLFLRDSHLARDEILVPGPLEQLLAEHEAGSADHGNRLWLLLSTEVWYRMYLEGTSVEELEAQIAAAA
ncbi:MAG: asparagine synthase (glutamine-hydrolyzing) [Proteobacteria bacterium]|nr:asparagine synthase (glutamine-hydrolyzing) [Pseudomonadota bacterium]